MLLFIFTVLYALLRIFLYYSKLCKSDYGLEMIVGQIGSGKTSIICDKMVKDLKNGWNVYADFHTNIHGVRFFDTTRLADCIPDGQSALYVDESALRWFSRDFRINIPTVFKVFNHLITDNRSFTTSNLTNNHFQTIIRFT